MQSMQSTGSMDRPMAALEEAPVGDLAYAVRVLPVLLGRNARRWLRFRVSVAMGLIAAAANASVFFFVGSVLAGGTQEAAVTGGRAGWLAHYAGFLAVGTVVSAILGASLTGPYRSLAMDYWMQRLETVLLSPCPLGLALIGDVVWQYVLALQHAAMLAAVGWLFGARLDATAAAAGLTLLALALAAVGALGYGLASASMFMLINAKGWTDPIGWAVGLLAGLATGVYFPISLLPGPLYHAALLLPHTYCIDAARRLLLPASVGATLPALPVHSMLRFVSPVQADLLALALGTVVLPLAGAALFAAGVAKARTDGGLSRWT
jgi:ABC-2 type transport system permease protein